MTSDDPIDAPPQDPPPTGGSWTAVLRPASEVELVFALAALEGTGIASFVHNGYFGALLVGPQMPLYNERTVFVPEADAERALETLRGLEHRGAPIRGHAAECDRLRVVGEALLLGWFVPGASRRARPVRALGLALLTAVPLFAALALALAGASTIGKWWEGMNAGRRSRHAVRSPVLEPPDELLEAGRGAQRRTSPIVAPPGPAPTSGWFVVDEDEAAAIAGMDPGRVGFRGQAPIVVEREDLYLPEDLLPPPERRLAIVESVVGTNGRVARARILERSAPETDPDRLRSLLSRWRFRPAVREDGRAWPVCYTLSIAIRAASERPAERPSLEAPAAALLEALDTGGRARVLQPFDSPERFEWSYLPGRRPGLALAEMEMGSARAAGTLLAASLSSLGLGKVETIRRLERVLFERSGWSARDPGRYFVAVWGNPTSHGRWGWRFEGHHVSLHWTVEDGRVVASAPQFLGANPAVVRDGPLRGTRALAREEDLARALVRSLNERQRTLAIADRKAPPDILSGAMREVRSLERRGITAAALSDEQRARLVELLREYAAVQPEAIAAERMERVVAELPGIRFLWMGGLEAGDGHYYRIQGTTFLVEYDNTQDGANHVHSVWRDLVGEWGPDPLAEHYRTAPHHSARR